MRPNLLRRRLFLAGFGAILAGALIGFTAPEVHADTGMNGVQFTGYLTAQLILIGALVFVVLIGVFRAIDWWSER